MASTVKNLANGQLPLSKGTLYTVPSSTSAIVSSIVPVNTDSVARTINLYYCKSGGVSRSLIPKDVSANAGKHYNLGTFLITMGAGDKIEGDASAATVVDYTISGVEIVSSSSAPSVSPVATASKYKVTTTAVNLTLTEAHEFVVVTAACTITLPIANLGAWYKIKSTVAGNVVVDTADTGTIDGDASVTMTVQYDSITVVCDGTNWHIV